MIANFGVGVDHLDLKLISSFGVKVTNTPFAVSNATADLGIALMLASSRRLVEGCQIAVSPDTEQFAADWLGEDVTGATLGIIGMGRIGYKVAKRAKAFDMRILYHNRNRRKEEEEQAVGACYCEKMEDLLQKSDFVMLVVNLTPQTHKLIGKRELELMKPTATLINICRGPVIDQDALVEALQNKVIKAAALDVTYPEPLPRDHPLLKLKNIIITPHIGTATKHARKKFWYDSPGLGSHQVYKPSGLAPVLKASQQRTRKEDSIRTRVLNIVLYKAITDMMSTCEVSQELYDLKLEISKVSLLSDFSVCRVYWNPTTVGDSKHVESILQKSALRIRYLLLARQVLGNVPPIVFVKDKAAVAMREIDELLAVADFGSEKENLSQNDFSESETSVTTSSSDTSASSLQSNLFGVDHEVLNKQIMEYKKMKKVKHVEGIGWAEQQQKQLAVVQKQMRMKKKKTKGSFQNDLTPQEYLLNKHKTDYLDDETVSFSENESEDELWDGVQHTCAKPDGLP
ncbi:putative ribosome-binding factor A, mitochondrial [Alligator mississippiensis]|uniref:Glyoxylate reductase/hydroxypyruvate reductase n=1 Tax=Alligator mississippiensis TaxID=8496 RepID=A0A151NF54_ALLMI|nr:putative ribosome-binding factor A, mitochondrial [Alligator mississippiensis]